VKVSDPKLVHFLLKLRNWGQFVIMTNTPTDEDTGSAHQSVRLGAEVGILQTSQLCRMGSSKGHGYPIKQLVLALLRPREGSQVDGMRPALHCL
jgi:hypothetical protein